MIAEMFHLDPADLLEETDPVKVGVRVAAFRVVQAAQQKASEKR